MSPDSRHTIDDRLVGTVIGRYRVKQVLDRGGMGAVYLAEHLLIDKPVVIKLLRPDLSHHEEMVGRFFNEAKAAAAIRHPGVIEIFDFGYHADGRAYIVMEHLDGHSLAHRLGQRGRLAEVEAAMIARSIASVLAAAHARGTVHRDLKPDNVFLVPDPDAPMGERIKVLDFGIAKLDDGRVDASRTRTGAIMGTPLYMAPEQARGARNVDARADLYALGCILYHMLCGRPPFVAQGEGEIIAMQLYAEPVPPRVLVPDLSPEIERVTMALLAKDPDQRTRTARELVDALGELVPQAAGIVPARSELSVGRTLDDWFTDSEAPQLEIIESVPPVRPRSRARWILPAIGAIAVGVLVGYAFVRSVSEEPIGAGHPARPMAAIVPAAKPKAAEPAPAPAPAPSPAPAPAPPPAPSTITLTVDTQPADAAITLDGEPQDRSGGAAIVVPRDGAEHALVATAPGFRSETKTFTADHDDALTIVLAPEPVAARTPPAPAAATPHLRHPSPAANRRPRPTPTPTPATSPNGSPIETDL